MTDIDSTSSFWYLFGGSFALVCALLLLFATAEKHQWRFGIIPSESDTKRKHDPFSFLKNTQPWFISSRSMR
jgi:hypothetical protein